MKLYKLFFSLFFLAFSLNAIGQLKCSTGYFDLHVISHELPIDNLSSQDVQVLIPIDIHGHEDVSIGDPELDGWRAIDKSSNC